MDELQLLEAAAPPTTALTDVEVEQWRAVVLDRISERAPVRRFRVRRHRRVVILGLIGVAVGVGGAAAASVLRGAGPNPGDQAAMRPEGNGAVLVVDPMPSHQVCVVVSVGVARGSGCVLPESPEVTTSYTSTKEAFALGVFDPRQRAAVVVVDGERVTPTSSPTIIGELTFFSLTGPIAERPHEIVVFDEAGTEIARFGTAKPDSNRN